MLAARGSVDEVTALAAYAQTLVTSHQVEVLPGGVLSEGEGSHEAGTPFLLVSVPTVHAADCAEHDLREIARIPDAAWAQGWTALSTRGLQIRIFPDADADEARAYIERYQAREAKKRRDLEALVQELLNQGGAPDTDIIGSGNEDGRGYVRVRVLCVDAADRAEAALLEHGLQLPWKMAGKKALVTRVYPE